MASCCSSSCLLYFFGYLNMVLDLIGVGTWTFVLVGAHSMDNLDGYLILIGPTLTIYIIDVFLCGLVICVKHSSYKCIRWSLIAHIALIIVYCLSYLMWYLLLERNRHSEVFGSLAQYVPIMIIFEYLSLLAIIVFKIVHLILLRKVMVSNSQDYNTVEFHNNPTETRLYYGDDETGTMKVN